MRLFKPCQIVSLFFICLLFILPRLSEARGPSIDPDLQFALDSFQPDKEMSVIIQFQNRIDFKQFRYKTRMVRRESLVKALRKQADNTQKSVLLFFKQKHLKRIRRLWINNSMALTAPVKIIKQLETFGEIISIRPDTALTILPSSPAPSSSSEWNIKAIHAPEVWDLGYSGFGIVIASMDTGVDSEHPDIKYKWRGGTNSWFDPNGEHDTPYDNDGHGTETMGIMVGGDNGGSFIGVAPDAQWIAVKVFNDSGATSLSKIHEGFQWLLDPDGNPETDDGPDVVNNSWGLTTEINRCVGEFREDIQTLREAGIFVVFSAGNDGPSQFTSLSPANYPESISVGSSDQVNAVTSFSSRGPSACDDGIYPMLVAPGQSIKTADITSGGIFPDSYVSVSGTSFSSPHVAGAIALLINAFPDANMEDIVSALKNSAIDLGDTGPDNSSGYGLLDVEQAYNLLEGASFCEDKDGDGFYSQEHCGTAVDCNDADSLIYQGAPEIKHNGIDEDCNGYDLTIDIKKAIFLPRKKILKVVATSDLGEKANLMLAGYGPMKWNPRASSWRIMVRHVNKNPRVLVISGIEGEETVIVQSKRRRHVQQKWFLLLRKFINQWKWLQESKVLNF